MLIYVHIENKEHLVDFYYHTLFFMTSNGLVANQAKTEFLVINEKDKSVLTELKVGLRSKDISTRLIWLTLFRDLSHQIYMSLFSHFRFMLPIPYMKQSY